VEESFTCSSSCAVVAVDFDFPPEAQAAFGATSGRGFFKNGTVAVTEVVADTGGDVLVSAFAFVFVVKDAAWSLCSIRRLMIASAAVLLLLLSFPSAIVNKLL